MELNEEAARRQALNGNGIAFPESRSVMEWIWVFCMCACFGCGYGVAYILHVPNYQPYRDEKGRFAKR